MMILLCLATFAFVYTPKSRSGRGESFVTLYRNRNLLCRTPGTVASIEKSELEDITGDNDATTAKQFLLFAKTEESFRIVSVH